MERAEATVESATETGLAPAIHSGSRNVGKPMAAQVRSRITDSFTAVELHIEQDNHPPALVTFYRRVAALFSIPKGEIEASDRAHLLAGLRSSLGKLHTRQAKASGRNYLVHAREQLLIERQRLILKNEIVQGYGRIEVWLLSVASLSLLMFNSVSLLWALPPLALSIGRSWYLDRQCKMRLRTVSEIDALIGRIEGVLQDPPST